MRGKQVRRLIKVEAILMSIVATIIGIFGGVLVARLLLAFFNSAGAGFPRCRWCCAPAASSWRSPSASA